MTKQSIEDVKVQIRQTLSNPNIGKTHQITLKDGPKAYRIATAFEILNGKTREIHHYSLKLDAFKVDRHGWITDKRSTLIASEPGEFEQLGIFINNIANRNLPDEDGIFHIVPDDTYAKLENIIKYVNDSDLSDKLRIMEAALADVTALAISSPEIASNNEELLKSIAVAAKMVSYRQAYEHLRNLVVANSSDEHAIQQILTEHPWLFGSEYSELLERRTWTRDDRLDFMLRRSIDGYLEIIEIKTPAENPLLRYDTSHDSYYASSPLSKVTGQVMRYIEEIERQRDSILALDGEEVLKIRARIIIGRDGDRDHQKALRNLNAYLYQIEILTFDQLLRIGERVLNMFASEISNELSDNLDDDIPF